MCPHNGLVVPGLNNNTLALNSRLNFLERVNALSMGQAAGSGFSMQFCLNRKVFLKLFVVSHQTTCCSYTFQFFLHVNQTIFKKTSVKVVQISHEDTYWAS